MQLFNDLGSLVERRWRDADYDEAIFPELAAQALMETAPSETVDVWDIIRWLNTTAWLPEQHDVMGNFGDPPITLYNGTRFYIDVYFWLDGTTAIHEHAFSGAFQVLLGSSILGEYDFDLEHQINARLAAGRIILKDVELLNRGDVRSIVPGSRYIHSLFHLDRPSVSLIIRTYQSPADLPQYRYYKPHLALDPFYEDQSIIKKVQAASLLFRMKHPDVDAFIVDLVACSDFHTTFSVLQLAFDRLCGDPLEAAFGVSTGRERFQAMLDAATRRHGHLANLIEPVLEEAQRENDIINRRKQITNADHRFCLALLLNVPDRTRLLGLVNQRFPDRDPVDTVADWVEELSTTRVWGSPEANVLGIDGFDDNHLFVFRGLLSGLSNEQIRAAFHEEYPSEDAGKLQDLLKSIFDKFRNSILFESILRNSDDDGSRSEGAI